MHIDIYFILLFQVSTVLFVYQLAIPINRVEDDSVKNELKKIRSDYDGAIGLGDIIVWPIILTIVFPFYILLRLIFKRKLLAVFGAILSDKQHAVIAVSILTIFLLLVTFAAFHWYIAYCIVLVPSIVHLIIRYKKEKSRFEL